MLVHDGASPFSGVFDEYFELSESLLLASGAGQSEPRLAPSRPDLVVLDVDAFRSWGRITLHAWIRSLDSGLTGDRPLIVLCVKTRGRRFTTSAMARLARDVARCARRIECAYYVAPSLERPIEFVPVDEGAVRAFDALSTRTWLRRTVRQLLIRTGLHDLLFKDLIVVVAP